MATGANVNITLAKKRFGAGQPPLFAGLELSVEAGSRLALVGASGVGKSSLLRMIAGLDRDFSGSILVDGTPAHRAETPGFVFQDPRLLPWLSATQNIAAIADREGVADPAELLSEVGLKGFENALPHELSGGMQRRVALARALSIKPKLLLLDEPFVSLDKPLAQDLHRLLHRLLEAYRPTVIMVSHDEEDAARLADRVIVLAGRPARIADDISFDTPAERRSDAQITAAARQVAEAGGLARAE